MFEEKSKTNIDDSTKKVKRIFDKCVNNNLNLSEQLSKLSVRELVYAAMTRLSQEVIIKNKMRIQILSLAKRIEILENIHKKLLLGVNNDTI